MVADKARWLAVDDAWDFALSESTQLPLRIEAKKEGDTVRFLTSRNEMEAFYQAFHDRLRPFTLSGSGDFHHLTALFIRQFSSPFVIVSFDNHPDWDIRPPFWCCGAWVNRALENPLVQSIAVWGCGSFECLFPSRLLGNASACKKGKLQVRPWKKNNKAYPRWLRPVTVDTWRGQFSNFVHTIGISNVYITVDMDCLAENEAVTNWESGSFSVEDLVWAINLLQSRAKIVGGDLCGAFSTARYSSLFRGIASKFDHPQARLISDEEAHATNQRTFQKIWPALTL